MAGNKFRLAATSDWFASEVGTATTLQQRAWHSISSGKSSIIAAPTGTGKTLAAFLCFIDKFYAEKSVRNLFSNHANASVKDAQHIPQQDGGVKVIYLSPLKALSTDISENLQKPIAGIHHLLDEQYPHLDKVTVGLRTGDSTTTQRKKLLTHPPDFLVTTPESLYILLSSPSGVKLLSTAEALIVDELHALQGSKRGSHLELSIARLTELIEGQGKKLQKIGLSATIHPLDQAAQWLAGSAHQAEAFEIIQASVLARPIDLQIALPNSSLTPVMSNVIWQELYLQLRDYIEQHNTTLIFVQSRRLAERIAKDLSDLMGENIVTSHHGSLSFEHRQQAEKALKNNRLKAVVTTSSLELGIDIGHLDLVIQMGSIASVNQTIQRIGRSGRGLKQTPKGVLFPLSSLQLVEAVAFMQAWQEQKTEPVDPCPPALDVLLQHIASMAITQDITLMQLCALCNATQTYASLTKDQLLRLVNELAIGFAKQYNRKRPLIYYDPSTQVIKPTKANRLTVLLNAGVIPDNFDYPVVLEPDNLKIGTISEDFAIENIPGTILQLGNHSYRFVRLENQVLKVTDAAGIPPTIPFWFGEGPTRSPLLVAVINRMRQQYQCLWLEHQHILQNKGAEVFQQAMIVEISNLWQLDDAAATQLHQFLDNGMHQLGALPDGQQIIFERFYDEMGDTHLVVHSGLGAKLNRAWGLALRKRFCARFNFELQAAASDDAIILSLGATHSFKVTDPAKYLSSHTAEQVLTQALLDAPLFGIRWRWVAANALAVQRHSTRGRVPPAWQRARTEDLLTLVFPDKVACLENISGDRKVPDHPLVNQALHDCLHGAMDTDGMINLLQAIHSGNINVIGVDTPQPSLMAHHIIASKPYAYLDEAGLEDRKTRNVAPPSSAQQQKLLPSAQALSHGFPLAVLEQMRMELWPPLECVEDVLYFIQTVGCINSNLMDYAVKFGYQREGLEVLINTLVNQQGIICFQGETDAKMYCSPALETQIQQLDINSMKSIYHSQADADQLSFTTELISNMLDILGPVTCTTLTTLTMLPKEQVMQSLLQLESIGYVAKGPYIAGQEAWCQQDILARLFKRFKRNEAQQYKLATNAQFINFLCQWQCIAPKTLNFERGLEQIIQFSEGLFLPLSVWEKDYFPQRLEQYQAQWLDNILLTGKWVWYIRPEDRKTFSLNTPITFIAREQYTNSQALVPGNDTETLIVNAEKSADLSSQAKQILEYIAQHQAPYTDDFFQISGQLKDIVKRSLAELVTKGLVVCDSFASLRFLTAKPRKMPYGFGRRRMRHTENTSIPGRWSLTKEGHHWLHHSEIVQAEDYLWQGEHQKLIHRLLDRYGVISYNIIQAEKKYLPSWREISQQCRRMEAQGVVLSGRFVNDGTGEQFASVKALQMLSSVRVAMSRTNSSNDKASDSIALNATEPVAALALNLHQFSQSSAAHKIDSRRNNYVTLRHGQVVHGLNNGEHIAFNQPHEQRIAE